MASNHPRFDEPEARHAASHRATALAPTRRFIALCGQAVDRAAPAATRAFAVAAWPAILALFFLGAFIPESVITGSTSPVRVVGDPAVLLYIIAFYGTANVLIREAWVRGKRDWRSFILLGLAFGIVNEGVVAGTWYHVAYAGYTYIGGVDLMWAVGLTAFHAAFSVAVPIALVGVLFPRRAGQPWLGRWGFVGCWLVLGLLTLGGVGLHEAQGYRVAALVLAVVLVVVALVRHPSLPPVPVPRPAPQLWTLRWSAFGLAVLHDALLFVVPPLVLAITRHAGVAQFVDMALFLVVWARIVAILRGWAARADWGPRQTLAVITGALIPGILLSFLPVAFVLLAPIFSLAFLGFLIWATRHTGKIAAQRP